MVKSFLSNRLLVLYIIPFILGLLSTLSFEPFNLTIPGKLQNYLALGKPIISFASGITNQIIKEANCGFTTDIDYLNIDELTDFIKNNKHEDQMSLNAQNYALNNFDKKNIINKLLLSM